MTLTNLQRKAKRLGYRVIKLRENHPDLAEYFPCVVQRIADGALVAGGLTMEEARKWLDNPKPREKRRHAGAACDDPQEREHAEQNC